MYRATLLSHWQKLEGYSSDLANDTARLSARDSREDRHRVADQLPAVEDEKRFV